MSGIDEHDSELHKRNVFVRSWWRQHAMVLLALLTIAGWLIAGLIYGSACANRMLAQEWQAKCLQSQGELYRDRERLAGYVLKDREAQTWKPGDKLPAMIGMEVPK